MKDAQILFNEQQLDATKKVKLPVLTTRKNYTNLDFHLAFRYSR